MKQCTRLKLLCHASFIIALAIASLSASCSSDRFCTSAILIHEFIPPSGGFTSPIYIAVSDIPKINEHFITQGIVLRPGDTLTELRLDPIVYAPKDDDPYANDVWFLVAEDTNGDGQFNTGDRYMPFSQINLVDGETLVLTTVDFSNPIGFNSNYSEHTFSIQHSNPELVDTNHKIFLFIDATQYPFSDPLLCKKFVFWYDSFSSAYFYWDKNGDNTLNTGDYNITTITGSFPSNESYILSPLMTY